MATPMATPGKLLQEWRKKSTFDVPALQNLLYTDEIVEFKNQVWDTLAKDPLFSDPNKELTLNEKRELKFRRLKRLAEYEFMSYDLMMSSPLKMPAFIAALLPFDGGLIASHLVTLMVATIIIIIPRNLCSKNYLQQVASSYANDKLLNMTQKPYYSTEVTHLMVKK